MIDFSCWNLTIPVGAETISTSRLNANYNDAFFIRNEDGTVTFRAPSSGEGIKSTKNSTYPRSELRETLEDGSIKQANWIPDSSEVHILEATLKVDSLPKSGKAIIGQFHGETDHPPMKIQITNDVIYAQLRRKLDGVEDKVKLLTDYKLGTYITYKVELFANGSAKFYIDGKQVINDILLEDGYQYDMTSYKNDSWYAKAGIYSQEKVGGVGIGQSTFKALRMYHGKVETVPLTPPTPVLSGIALLSAAVASILAGFKAGSIASATALAEIQVLKVKADTEFVKSAERTTFYDQVVAARAVIRAPVIVPTGPEAELNALALSYATKSISLIEAKTQFNEIVDVIDELPDGPEQTSLYGLARTVKAQLI